MQNLGRTVAIALVLSATPALADDVGGPAGDDIEMRLAAGVEGLVGAGYDDLTYGIGGAIGFRTGGFTMRARADVQNSDAFWAMFVAPEVRFIARDRVFFAVAPGYSRIDARASMSDIISDVKDHSGFAAQGRVGAFITTGPRRLAVSLAYEHIWRDYRDGDKLVTLALGFESL